MPHAHAQKAWAGATTVAAPPEPANTDNIACDCGHCAECAAKKKTMNTQGDTTVPKLTEPEKKTIVDALVSNSEVFDEADRPTLNAMTDAKLLRFNALFQKKKKKEGDDSDAQDGDDSETENEDTPTTMAANCAVAPALPLNATTLLSTINTVRRIDRLTAHVTDQKVKDRLVTNLAAKTDAELDDLVLMLPPDQQPVHNALPALLPIFGASPVYNQEQPTDNEHQPMPMKAEAIDYAAISKSHDKRTA